VGNAAAPVDIRTLVDDVVAALRVKGVPPGIAIETHGRGTADVDDAKLRQVVTNLIVNAVEACGKEGRVVLLVDESGPGVVSVEVHDTGSGLTPAARERIFEPFFTTKATGSGLGLAIARAIARAHGGEVAIVSTTDRGTIFRLTVPAKKREATA
jgi:signal transduction histidine kinase